jgi:hypothetical protein
MSCPPLLLGLERKLHQRHARVKRAKLRILVDVMNETNRLAAPRWSRVRRFSTSAAPGSSAKYAMTAEVSRV